MTTRFITLALLGLNAGVLAGCSADVGGEDIEVEDLEQTEAPTTVAAPPGLEVANCSPARYVAEELAGADLSAFNICGCTFTSSDSSRARLENSVLSDCDFQAARADGASFYGASLGRANFSGARANFASFRRADLTGAVLRGATLKGADFSGADLRGVDFTNADLTEASFCDAITDGREQFARATTNGARCL